MNAWAHGIQERHGPISTLAFSRVPWRSWAPGPYWGPKTAQGACVALPFTGPFGALGALGQGTLAILAPWAPRGPLGLIPGLAIFHCDLVAMPALY